MKASKESEETPQVFSAKTYEAIETLFLYEEEAWDGKVELIDALHGQRKVVKTQQFQCLQQMLLHVVGEPLQ